MTLIIILVNITIKHIRAYHHHKQIRTGGDKRHFYNSCNTNTLILIILKMLNNYESKLLIYLQHKLFIEFQPTEAFCNHTSFFQTVNKIYKNDNFCKEKVFHISKVGIFFIIIDLY